MHPDGRATVGSRLCSPLRLCTLPGHAAEVCSWVHYGLASDITVCSKVANTGAGASEPSFKYGQRVVLEWQSQTGERNIQPSLPLAAQIVRGKAIRWSG
jgi:hypothetical protein